VALVTVKRIVQGYSFVHQLRFASPGGGAPSMPDLTVANRITGGFRSTANPSLPVIATLDTADGSLTPIDAATLRMAIPAAVTALFPLTGVALAFARLDAGLWSPLPVVFPAWPVRGGVPS